MLEEIVSSLCLQRRLKQRLGAWLTMSIKVDNVSVSRMFWCHHPNRRISGLPSKQGIFALEGSTSHRARYIYVRYIYMCVCVCVCVCMYYIHIYVRCSINTYCMGVTFFPPKDRHLPRDTRVSLTCLMLPHYQSLLILMFPTQVSECLLNFKYDHSSSMLIIFPRTFMVSGKLPMVSRLKKKVSHCCRMSALDRGPGTRYCILLYFSPPNFIGFW